VILNFSAREFVIVDFLSTLEFFSFKAVFMDTGWLKHNLQRVNVFFILLNTLLLKILFVGILSVAVSQTHIISTLRTKVKGRVW